MKANFSEKKVIKKYSKRYYEIRTFFIRIGKQAFRYWLKVEKIAVVGTISSSSYSKDTKSSNDSKLLNILKSEHYNHIRLTGFHIMSQAIDKGFMFTNGFSHFTIVV